MNKTQTAYEEARLDIILFDGHDVIATSPLDKENNSDGDGWTSGSW